MAREYWISGNYGDARRDQTILRLCRSAVEIDAGYAAAWALMALMQADIRYRGTDLDDDGMAAAEKALQLRPTLAEPHCVKARYFAQHGRHDEAIAEIAIAVSLDPDSWEVNKEAAFVSSARANRGSRSILPASGRDGRDRLPQRRHAADVPSRLGQWRRRRADGKDPA